MIKDEKIIRHSFAENDVHKRTDVLTKEGSLSADSFFEIREKMRMQLSAKFKSDRDTK